MSEIMLNVCDASRALHTTIHASRVDYLVAALSADPETIEELQAALARYLPEETSEEFFAHWRSGINQEPWDAGVCVIDLAAKLVAMDSTYAHPGPSDGVEVDDPRKNRRVGIRYHVADDWLFQYHFDGWDAVADRRRRERLATPSLDARAVLYGKLCEHIAQAFLEPEATAVSDEAAAKAIRASHAQWLLTPRTDLNGQSPRELLLARESHLSWELQDRSEQWSLLGKCPPGLAPDSVAYRFGGFGTHEIVVYYELVRFLFWDHWERVASGQSSTTAAEIARLEAVRDEWLQTPNLEDFSGRTPATVIERERLRLPEGGSGKEHIIDCDCPLCQMMADDGSIMFWHLDGSGMDDEFAFSFYLTREEWDEEQRRYEEWSRKFDEEQRERQAAKPDVVWQRSYVNTEAFGDSPQLVLFGLGAHLAELTQDLKDAAADQGVIDDLNRVFGNLSEVVQQPKPDLIEPVARRLCDSLALIGENYAELAVKCDDLEQQLGAFVRKLTCEPDWDEEMPF